MSAISSQLSFPSSGHWNLNPRVFNIMDSIYAIAFGLGLRTLVDAVSQDIKLTGSLIGLWEGVITLHFVKKMPKSSDPYIAYGVRLFIDFLITESIERMVLVLIWSAFGLVLADVTPAIWDEVGLNRVWRHFRRDLYTIYDKIPTVAFFPPQRTVRFLPPREREREREPGEISPSIAPSQEGTPLAVIPPLPSELSESLKHRVPGYYPGDYSDTDTDFGSINRSRTSPRTEVNNATVSDLDEGNQSSAITSPALTHDEIPDMDEVLVDVGIKEVLPVPIPKEIAFPPTPSDSAARWDIHRDVVDGVLHAKPPGQDLPDILDLGEDGGTSDDWEKIHRRDYDENGSPSPPTPPAKDRFPSVQISPIIPTIIPTIIPPTTLPVSSPITDNRRESLPPAYSSHDIDDLEDIYYYPEKKPIVTAADDHANVNEHVGNDNNDSNDLFKIPQQQAGDSDSANPWAGPVSSDATAQVQGDAEIQAEEAAERKRKEEEESSLKEAEEEERKRKEEEEERKRMEAEDERKRKEAEEETKRIEEAKFKEETKRKEKEEAKRKEEEEAKRKEEEEAKQREEERKQREVEEALKAQQAEELRREKEAEKKRKAVEAAERKKKEEDDDALRKQRQAETEQKRKDEEAAEKKRKDEEAAEKKRKDEEAAEKKRKDEEAAEKKRKDEEAAEKKRKEKEAEQKEKEEAERKRQDEAAAHAQKEAKETETEQAKLDKQNADTPGDQTTEEKEDDSKTVHELDIYGDQPQKEGPSESNNVQDSTSPTHGDFTEEESVVSTATTADPPQEAKVRLERMMILRAQMVEVENRLDELEGKGIDETSPEMKAAEKTLRKFRRQAERRYNAAVGLAKYLEGPYDTDDEISMEALTPRMAGVKVEEKLEQLLTPSSHSIYFKLIFGSNAKSQKPVVLNTLTTYNLFDYTIIGEKGKKRFSIEIPEERFAGWLTAYRTLVAKRDSDEGDNEGWSTVR